MGCVENEPISGFAREARGVKRKRKGKRSGSEWWNEEIKKLIRGKGQFFYVSSRAGQRILRRNLEDPVVL